MVTKFLMTKIGMVILEALFAAFGTDVIREEIDEYLDRVEDNIEAEEDWYDPMLFLLINTLRELLAITEEEGSPYADE